MSSGGAGAGPDELDATSNNGLHPTADTEAFIYINQLGRRVMPGVSLLRVALA